MIELKDIYEMTELEFSNAVITLYDLLKERPAYANISHKKMPTFQEHVAFVKRMPYDAWYIIRTAKMNIGSIYLTERSEIGIFIFKSFAKLGYGTQAIELLRARHDGPLYANIAPENFASQAFFQRNGFKKIQETYLLEDVRPQ